MGRAPCCSKVGLHRGAWSDEEDKLLTHYIQAHGEGQWRSMPSKAGLLRCGKSCRLRWMNYLRPGIKRGNFTAEEDDVIIRLHSVHGSRWSLIASELSGRTDNEIKNYWNSHLKRKLVGDIASENQPDLAEKKKKLKKKRKTADQKSTKVNAAQKEEEEEEVIPQPTASSSSLLPSSQSQSQSQSQSHSQSSSSTIDQGEGDLQFPTDFCWPDWSPLFEMDGGASSMDMTMDGLDWLMMKHDDGKTLEKLYDECLLLIQDHGD